MWNNILKSQAEEGESGELSHSGYAMHNVDKEP
jgi:hypothetical protein